MLVGSDLFFFKNLIITGIALYNYIFTDYSHKMSLKLMFK